ncbi:MAG: hypothetical protein R3C14_43120 [Caldilineaceae bacterium]
MSFFLILILLLLGLGYLMRRRQQQQRKQTLTRQLYAWASQTPTLEPDLQQWIQRLPAPEAAVLVDLLSGYCASLNWELAWLFAPQIERAPTLKQALEESVIAYARAILTGLQMEEDVRAYQAYLAFARKPTARKQRPLVQKLYPKLQAEAPPARAASSKLSWLPWSSAKQKANTKQKSLSRKEQITVIQRAFDHNPARAMELLKEVLAEEAASTVAQAKQQATSSLRLGPLGAAA